MDVVSKPELSHQPITKGIENTVNQSKLVVLQAADAKRGKISTKEVLVLPLIGHREPSHPFKPTFVARVLCFGGHFEFLIRVRSASARSRTEITVIARSLLRTLRKLHKSLYYPR